ncbi:MAG TPA: hypothetical protein VF770_05590 [Solirubrobacterales bacterium]
MFAPSPGLLNRGPRGAAAPVLGVIVAVCSAEDLRAMKRAAGRTRDLADLEDLDAIED